MSCSAHCHSCLCRPCKKIAKRCEDIVAAGKKKRIMDSEDLYPPRGTRPSVYEITTTQPFDELNDGWIIGQQIRKALKPVIGIDDIQQRRFFMWIQRGLERGGVRISILIDTEAAIYSSDTFLETLPTKFVNEQFKFDIQFENAWTNWQTFHDDDPKRAVDPHDHAPLYRFKFMTELLKYRHVTYSWMNFQPGPNNKTWINAYYFPPFWEDIADLSVWKYRGDSQMDFSIQTFCGAPMPSAIYEGLPEGFAFWGRDRRIWAWLLVLVAVLFPVYRPVFEYLWLAVVWAYRNFPFTFSECIDMLSQAGII